MSEPIAQRTLVKSPPELWAEISDVEALAHHLGAFGEIRITRVVPETSVAWEGDTARGTVELSAAGWGTKVTLRATATGAPAEATDVRTTTDAPAPGAPAAPATASNSPATVGDAPVTPSAYRDERAPQAPGPEPYWAASVEQKVRDRYVGSAPSVTAPAIAAAPLAVPAVSSGQSPAPHTSALPDDATTPPAGTAEDRAVEAQTAAAERAPSPPRGLLARLRWWFSPPVEESTPAAEPEVKLLAREQAHGEPAAADPQGQAPATDEPPQPAGGDAPTSTPTVLPFPGGQPAPAPPPETPPAAAVHAVPPPATPAGHAAPQALKDPVDEGTIVGILTGVLDELGSARHRPFSRS